MQKKSVYYLVSDDLVLDRLPDVTTSAFPLKLTIIGTKKR
ncbi:hypothetical protein HMPREF9104_00091 [Lentilactobacillus kisonensis F0435]|uniref:Uncharacterized protein n=1 Tax=Lentilactobacillus kisonensis F0435 TaxID=797516 RepID=H1LBY0_9LACO|nr:hypothetical protein HMPREF9104_00091 [Lentilactobacillus kisonensis F0435]